MARGPRSELFRLTAGDGPELVALARASRALHRGWARPPDTLAAFRLWRQRARGDDLETLVLRRREDGALLGVFELSQIARGNFQSAYLGFFGAQAHARQGYMKEGLELVLRFAFGRLRLHRLEANVQPDNRASLALVRAAGFRREGYSPRYLRIAGRWRDHERWAVLAEDRRPRAKGPPPKRRARSRAQ